MGRKKTVPEIHYGETKAEDGELRKPLCWETFFWCQRSPILRSQLLTMLMAGTPLEAERVPTEALLDVVLLAMTARQYHEAEIVDDFTALCTRTEEKWSAPDWTTKVFNSAHGNAANCILKGSREFVCAEERYIPAMVAWYMRHDPPSYFSRELTEKDFPKVFTKRKNDATFAVRSAQSSGNGAAALTKAERAKEYDARAAKSRRRLPLKVSDVAVAKKLGLKGALIQKRVVTASPVKRKNPPIGGKKKGRTK